jgi:hypothetical protein
MPIRPMALNKNRFIKILSSVFRPRPAESPATR